MTDAAMDVLLDRHTVILSGGELHGRSFLLGDRTGFALYLPATRNRRDATLQGSKWYGASGFAQSFLDDFVSWVEVDGHVVRLDRDNQTGFIMQLDEAIRVFRVAGQEVRERYFVPNKMHAVVVSLEGNFTFGVRPEFDMRYYQSFNSDFSSYRARHEDGCLLVRNRVADTGPDHEDLNFISAIGSIEPSSIEMRPAAERLIHKTYLKDEARAKTIESVYSETEQRVPDEAPIWDQYSTEVFSPASIRARGPLTLVCAFGDTEEVVRSSFEDVKSHLDAMRRAKRDIIAGELTEGRFETGHRSVDDAYAHVLTRFNDCLVVRDAALSVSGQQASPQSSILAGNKYFTDPWKRDENISLGALLATNDYETVRAILHSTWQFQDERTGRLPQIIRVGEPLVYYSSDGTLWALHRLFEYVRQSGDTSLLAEKMPMVRHFFQASMPFVRHGLLPSGGIIDAQYLWETWEDTPFTPRNGYPVEIELLWLTALGEFADSVDDELLARTMRTTRAEGIQTFEQFYQDAYLADSLGYDWAPNRSLTPNGYLAFDLSVPLPPRLERGMLALGKDQLAGRRGVRSLAPRDWPVVFPKAFLDDPRSHTGKNMASFGTFNYHRGIEWEWLNSSFVAGELKFENVQDAYRLYTRGQIDGALTEAGIGGLSELNDEHGPLGADFQAWSMAALIDSLHCFAGVTVDAVAGHIRIAPSIPAEWPYIKVRRRIGDLCFDLHYEVDETPAHQIRVTPHGQVPPGYTVEIAIRVPHVSAIAGATSNDTPLADSSWTYSGFEHAASGRASLSLPFTEELNLRITIE